MTNYNAFGDNQFMIIPPFDQTHSNGEPVERVDLGGITPLASPGSISAELSDHDPDEPGVPPAHLQTLGHEDFASRRG